MNLEYKIISTLNGERYVLHTDGKPTGAPLKEVSICFDAEEGFLHKHGGSEMVSSWFNTTRNKLINSGLEDMALALKVATGPFPIEELNKIISISGYCTRFFKDQPNLLLD